MNAAPKPDPLAAAYKQGWTTARNEWKPRAEKAEADARREFELGNDWMERALKAEAKVERALKQLRACEGAIGQRP